MNQGNARHAMMIPALLILLSVGGGAGDGEWYRLTSVATSRPVVVAKLSANPASGLETAPGDVEGPGSGLESIAQAGQEAGPASSRQMRVSQMRMSRPPATPQEASGEEIIQKLKQNRTLLVQHLRFLLQEKTVIIERLRARTEAMSHLLIEEELRRRKLAAAEQEAQRQKLVPIVFAYLKQLFSGLSEDQIQQLTKIAMQFGLSPTCSELLVRTFVALSAPGSLGPSVAPETVAFCSSQLGSMGENERSALSQALATAISSMKGS